MTSKCQLQFKESPGDEVIFCVIPTSTSAEYSLPSPAPARRSPSAAAALFGSSLSSLKSNPPSPVITLIDPRMSARVSTETGGVSPQRGAIFCGTCEKSSFKHRWYWTRRHGVTSRSELGIQLKLRNGPRPSTLAVLPATASCCWDTPIDNTGPRPACCGKNSKGGDPCR